MASFAPAGTPASSSITILAAISCVVSGLTLRVALLYEIHDVWVVRAATAHENLESAPNTPVAHFVDVLARCIAFVMVDDGLCGDTRGSRDNIVW